ncbi:MAG: ArsA family ATPase [Candidatus Bathyarchaeota archaeon]|nr:ArsA family ATPase [Candidatus Bathyarchaeota archaeon]
MKMDSISVNEKPIIVMFCGKGGVGKTTCASATAIHYASKGYKTLLISTDPSPSLSDILELNVKGEITKVSKIPQLDAVELDYSKIFDMWLEKFGDEVYEVISSFLPVGREILDYIAGAPGIDEEFALSYVYDIYTSGEYEVIIWDTAPAGGTLSLLHIQETFYTHMRDAAKLYIKLKETLESLTGREKRDPLRIIREWEILAKNVLDMVRSEYTTAYLVTIPEGLGVAQTERIWHDFDKFGIKIGGVIVNNLIPDNIILDTGLLQKRREVQSVYVNTLEEQYAEALLVKLHLQDYEVKGISALKDVEKELYN